MHGLDTVHLPIVGHDTAQQCAVGSLFVVNQLHGFLACHEDTIFRLGGFPRAKDAHLVSARVVEFLCHSVLIIEGLRVECTSSTILLGARCIQIESHVARCTLGLGDANGRREPPVLKPKEVIAHKPPNGAFPHLTLHG